MYLTRISQMCRKICLWGVVVFPSGFGGGLNGFAECLGSLGRPPDVLAVSLQP
jgi:hypothetical protein